MKARHQVRGGRAGCLLMCAISQVAFCASAADAVFRSGTEWRAEEKASLEQDRQAHPWKRATNLGLWLMAPDRPLFRAVWTNDPVRHVCLSPGSGNFEVRVFDEQGRLLEDNIVCPEPNSAPARLVSVSPIRIAFSSTNFPPNAERVVNTRFTKEEAMAKIAEEDREASEMYQRVLDDLFRAQGKPNPTNKAPDKQPQSS